MQLKVKILFQKFALQSYWELTTWPLPSRFLVGDEITKSERLIADDRVVGYHSI